MKPNYWKPTRLSVKRDDPGYPSLNSLRARSERVIVFLDAVEVKHCITADSDEFKIIAMGDGSEL